MRAGWALAVAVLVAALDQLTKAWLVAALPLGSEREVVGGLFRLVHTRNRGVAFGLLGATGPLVQTLLLVTVIAVVLLVVRQLRRAGSGGLAVAGLALILGGALGNLADRLLRGEVVDFLDFFIRLAGRERHWPAFNLADSCISVGAGLVVLAELLLSGGRARAAGSD